MDLKLTQIGKHERAIYLKVVEHDSPSGVRKVYIPFSSKVTGITNSLGQHNILSHTIK